MTLSQFLRRWASLLGVLGLSACAACQDPVDDQVAAPKPPAAPVAPVSWAARADSAQATLPAFLTARGYVAQNNAGDARFNYWWQAHYYDVLLDGYARTRNAAYLTRLKQAYEAARAANGNTYLNEFYDDMQWHALACLRAFELTQDPVYKTTVDQLWADIKTGWNTQQGGGIAWKKTQLGYKNTPANAPAAILAARLYTLSRNPDDLAWAQRIYDWQKQTLVDPSTGTVWDGINRLGNGQIDRDWKFTYTQGVFIGAGLALYRATQNQQYLQDAIRTASYAVNDAQLAPGGVLKDEGGGDGGLFKGILVRYLVLLAQEPAVPAATRATYVSFLRNNGQTLWQRGTRRPQLLFHTAWTTPPPAAVDGSTQLSGVMLTEALATLP